MNKKYIIILLFIFFIISNLYGQSNTDIDTGSTYYDMVTEFLEYYSDDNLRKKYGLPESKNKSGLTKDQFIDYCEDGSNLKIISGIINSFLKYIKTENNNSQISYRANTGLIMTGVMLKYFKDYRVLIENEIDDGLLSQLALFAEKDTIDFLVTQIQLFKTANPDTKNIFGSDDIMLEFLLEYFSKNQISFSDKKEMMRIVSLDISIAGNYVEGLYLRSQNSNLQEKAQSEMVYFINFISDFYNFIKKKNYEIDQSLLSLSYTYLLFYIGEKNLNKVLSSLEGIPDNYFSRQNLIPYKMIKILRNKKYPQIIFDSNYSSIRKNFLSRGNDKNAFKKYFETSILLIGDNTVKQDFTNLSLAYIQSLDTAGEDIAFIFKILFEKSGDSFINEYSKLLIKECEKKLSSLNMYRLELLNDTELISKVKANSNLRIIFVEFLLKLNSKSLTKLLKFNIYDMIPLAGNFFNSLDKNNSTQNKLKTIVESLNIYKEIITLLLDNKYPKNDNGFNKYIKKYNPRYNAVFSVYSKQEIQKHKSMILFMLKDFKDFIIFDFNNKSPFLKNNSPVIFSSSDKLKIEGIINLYHTILNEIKNSELAGDLQYDGFSDFIFINIITHGISDKNINKKLDEIFKIKYSKNPNKKYFLLLFSAFYISLDQERKSSLKIYFSNLKDFNINNLNKMILNLNNENEIIKLLDIFLLDENFTFVNDSLGLHFFEWKNMNIKSSNISSKLSKLAAKRFPLINIKIENIRELNKSSDKINSTVIVYLNKYIVNMYSNENIVPLPSINLTSLEDVFDLLAFTIILFDEDGFGGNYNHENTYLYKLAKYLYDFGDKNNSVLNDSHRELYENIGSDSYKDILKKEYMVKKFESPDSQNIYFLLSEFLQLAVE